MHVSDLLDLMRLHNCVLAGAGTTIGGIVAVGGVPSFEIAFAFIAAALITGAGNAVNDYADREIDSVNNPGRPIPSGRVSPSHALLIAKLFFVAGMLSAFFTQRITYIIFAGFNSALLYVYASSLKEKGLVGNLTVSYLVGSLFLFGGLAVGGSETVAILAVMAGFSTGGRELVKDIEDLEGDMESGSRSFPIRFGSRKAVILASVMTLVAIVATPVPYLMDVFGVYYLPPVAVSIVAFSAGIGVVVKEPERGAARSSLLYKVGMLMGLVAFLVGALA